MCVGDMPACICVSVYYMDGMCRCYNVSMFTCACMTEHMWAVSICWSMCMWCAHAVLLCIMCA